MSEFHSVAAAAALRLRAGQQAQGQGPRRRRRHHRPRHGQSRLWPRPKHVIDKLVETVGKPRTDRYSASKGIPGLRRAQAGYYARRFGVKLDPDTQVVATLGSKEGFANMAQAITAPGDVVLVPNPSYPIHAFGFLMAGGVIRSVPAEPTPEYLPRARAGHPAFDPEADRGRRLLSLEPDRDGRLARFLQGSRALREEARDLRALRPRLWRGLFRRRAAAVRVAGAGRLRRRGRVHLDVEDLFDGRLAHGLRGRQRAAACGAGAGEIVSRLRRLHADPGRRRGRAQRPGRLHQGDARDLQAPARRDGREFCRRRLADRLARAPRCSPGRRCRKNSAISAAWSFRSC